MKKKRWKMLTLLGLTILYARKPRKAKLRKQAPPEIKRV